MCHFDVNNSFSPLNSAENLRFILNNIFKQFVDLFYSFKHFFYADLFLQIICTQIIADFLYNSKNDIIDMD